MEKGVNNPHDKFFKALLSDKESAVAFLKLSLDKETLDALDLESITLVNTHFISSELEESFSDIILSAKLLNSEANCYVSILLEHKSYKDDYVEFQVLSYLSQAYQRQIKNGEQLQLIIPIIYYHGEEKWSPPQMVDHFKVEPKLLKYVPNFERIFINLMSLTETAIDSIADTFLHPALQLQRNRFDQQKAVENFARIVQSLSPYTSRNLLQSFFVYSISVYNFDRTSLIEIIENIPSKLKSDIMSLYDQIKYEGEIKGEINGERKGKIEVVIKSHENSLSIEMISNITGLSETEVKQILNIN